MNPVDKTRFVESSGYTKPLTARLPLRLIIFVAGGIANTARQSNSSKLAVIAETGAVLVYKVGSVSEKLKAIELNIGCDLGILLTLIALDACPL